MIACYVLKLKRKKKLVVEIQWGITTRSISLFSPLFHQRGGIHKIKARRRIRKKYKIEAEI